MHCMEVLLTKPQENGSRWDVDSGWARYFQSKKPQNQADEIEAKMIRESSDGLGGTTKIEIYTGKL